MTLYSKMGFNRIITDGIFHSRFCHSKERAQVTIDIMNNAWTTLATPRQAWTAISTFPRPQQDICCSK